MHLTDILTDNITEVCCKLVHDIWYLTGHGLTERATPFHYYWLSHTSLTRGQTHCSHIWPTDRLTDYPCLSRASIFVRPIHWLGSVHDTSICLGCRPICIYQYHCPLGRPVCNWHIIHTLPTTKYLPMAIGKCTHIYYTTYYGPTCWYHMYIYTWHRPTCFYHIYACDGPTCLYQVHNPYTTYHTIPTKGNRKVYTYLLYHTLWAHLLVSHVPLTWAHLYMSQQYIDGPTLAGMCRTWSFQH
jgi:hypothetical protein